MQRGTLLGCSSRLPCCAPRAPQVAFLRTNDFSTFPLHAPDVATIRSYVSAISALPNAGASAGVAGAGAL